MHEAAEYVKLIKKQDTAINHLLIEFQLSKNVL